jgi:hypothetical protein
MEDNIKMALKEIRFEDVKGIQQAQDRVQCRVTVNTVLHFWVPQKGNILTS